LIDIRRRSNYALFLVIGACYAGDECTDRHIFEVAKEAGRHLAKGQKISQETLDIVSLEIMPTEKYVQVVTSI
jgi:hypothetical protein